MEIRVERLTEDTGILLDMSLYSEKTGISLNESTTDMAIFI